MNDKPQKTFLQKISSFLSLSILIAFISGAGLIYFTINYYRSAGPLPQEKTVIIPDGSSVKTISKLLAKEEIIKHPELFRTIIRIGNSGNRMKAGEYAFSPKISPLQVFHKISSGDVVTHNITIPEGLMTFQILDTITNAEFLTGEVPTDINEGELLPETYDYHYGDNREKLVRRMQKAMQQTLDEAWTNKAENVPVKTRQEALTLASIIEKETAIAGERKHVASVFVNRLRKRMRLQTDPTVIYAITQGKYEMERPLIFKDLEYKSPYNTYRNYGLPPGPISNPGKASIEAALNPDETNYYYFVADGTGGHKFATTLKEHNDNVRNWRKINKK